ncbi:MAG: AAA family ATPase [Lachnospiraceae bacterium]|nr:AAA family ATPase [Lachnospiraceae bacterium]
MRAYPNEKLYTIAQENYDILQKYCEVLEQEGYWEHPQIILNRQISDFLALYIQAMLIQVADYIKAQDVETLRMIIGVTGSNPLAVDERAGITEEIAGEAKKLVSAPPVLLQLCSLRDVEHHSSMTGLFFDAVLNIIFATAYLNRRGDATVTRYVREYYGRIQFFVQNANSCGACVDEQYIFHKICVGDLEGNTALLKEAGEDFAGYKKEAFLLKDKSEGKEKPAISTVGTVSEVQDGGTDDPTDSGDGYGYSEDEEFEEEAEYYQEEFEEPDELVCADELADVETVDILPVTVLSAAELLRADRGNAFDTLVRHHGQIEEENEPEADIVQEDAKRVFGAGEEVKGEEETVCQGSKSVLSPPGEAGCQEAEAKKEPVKETISPVSEVDKEAATRAALASFKAKRMEKLMNRLDELVGLHNVKEEVRSLVNLIRVRKMREEYHLPGMPMSYHMVFTGSPGTGKTTVARLIGEIYRELGILSKGMMVETDRAGLVAGYVGQTALKVKEVVDRARGGILFIDEAYTLSSVVGGNDFGTEAIDMLVKLMEDYREDLVIIVAGYTQEMETFLKSNTGLISRFNKFIDFPDYGEGELVDILYGMAKRAGFSLQEEVLETVRGYLSRLTEQQRDDFGNARGIRNLFEKMVAAHANRVIGYGQPTKEQLSVITSEDCKFFA